eukprot:TRINITY_DN49_c0_g1_i1.p1 TRINITY_DN49_c0_g1~~TRINITY_DN49_c0_g1_i1.p1  ORF type:complete len:217 (-),score=81.12 TRINITY_DN49_c0_g1_i1:111-761(-)
MSADAQVKKLEELLAKVEQQVTRIEGKLKGGSSSAASSSSSGGSSAASKEFGNLVADHLPKFLEAANKIGGEVAQQAALFEKALNALQAAIGRASENKKPANQNDLQAFFKDVIDLCGQITAVHEKAGRAHKQGQLLQAVAEANGAVFSWVFVEPAPVPFVEENRGSAEFYSNRVIRDQKGKDEVQVQWATSFNAFLKSLAPYIKQYHTTGLSWKK